MAKKKKDNNFDNVFGGITTKKQRDDITTNLISAVSKQPTKNKAQQKKKADTLKKLNSALTHQKPARSRKGVTITSPSIVKGQRQEAAQTAATTTPSLAKAERQQEMHIKGIVGSKSPELSAKLSNSLSLGTGLQKPEEAASSAVAAIRNDDSSLARKAYNTQHGLSGGLTAGDFQRTAGSATRTGALSGAGIADNADAVEQAKQKAAAAPDHMERAVDEHPLLMRAVKDIGNVGAKFNPLTQALYNIATREMGAENSQSLSDRVGDSGISGAVAKAVDYSDRMKGRYAGGAYQALEDVAGAVSSYGNKALSAGARMIGADGAADTLNAAAEKTVSDGLFGNLGSHYQEYLTEKYGKSGITDSVAQNIGYMTPSLMASYLTAGTSAAAQGAGAIGQAGGRFASLMSSMAGGNTGLAVMAVQQAQSSANEAYHEGASLNQSLAYGAAAGMLSAVTERIAGGIPGLPEGVLTEAVTSRISNNFTRNAVAFAIDKLGEGFEEVAETALTPYLKRAIYNPDAPQATAEELADSMLMGVMVSAILSAPADLSNLSNLRSGYHGGAQAETEFNGTLDAVRQAVAEAQQKAQSALESTQETPESAQERVQTGTDEITSEAKNNAQRASETKDAETVKNETSGAENRSAADVRERVLTSQESAQETSENAQERVQTESDETIPAMENRSQTASEDEKTAPRVTFENPIAQLVYDRQTAANRQADIVEQTVSEGLNSDASGTAELAQAVQNMSEAELYQAVKDGDVSFDDLAAVLNYQAEQSSMEQNVFDPDVLHQSVDEINADIDAGAYTVEELYDVIRAHNDSVEQTGTGQKIDASAVVQDVLAASAEIPAADSGFSEAEHIADTSHDDATARYLKGKIADVARSVHDLNSVYFNRSVRDGTILGRKEFTAAMRRELDTSLREMQQRMAAPDSPQSRAAKYRDVNIQYDINDPNQDIQLLLDAWEDYYAVEQEFNDLVSERFKASADGRPSTDREIAEACVKHGDISYLWSVYQHDMPSDVDAIVRYYELKTAMNDINRPQRAYNRSRYVAESALAHEMCEGIERAHDMKGIQLNAKSPRRVLESVYKNQPEMAQKVYDAYIAPLTHGSAQANFALENDRKTVADTGLKRREQQYTQMYMDNDARVANQVAEFKEKYHRKINEGKVEEASKVIKQILDEIHPKVNQALVRNGYRPMGKLDNYSPHFEEQLTGIQNMLRRVGIYKPTSVRFSYEDTAETESYEPRVPGELPTAIAGRTEEFRGRHKWSGNIKKRTGFHTDYNIYTALESYLPNMYDIIYLTDGVSHLRAYENQIRYETASMDIQQSYENILAEESTDPITKQQQIEELFKATQGFDDTASKAQRFAKRDTPANNLSGYVTWLRRYTDTVAGKKSIEDRCMEYTLGRTSYKNVSSVFNRIAANMVTTFSSSATNLIPLAWQTGEVSPKHLASALMDTAKNAVSSDGFADMSDFLVNRRGGGTNLNTSAFGRAVDKLQVVDEFTAQVVTRAYYKQGLSRGMSHLEALDFANQRAGDLMADRNKTQLPLMFQSSNPVQKALTLFQVEVNNNVQHIFHDLPKRAAEEGVAKVCGGLAVSFLAVAGFNKLFEEVFGYMPEHFSPVDWIVQFLDLDKEDDEEKDTLYQDLLELVGNVADAAPVVSNFTGGGRIPLTSAIPGGSPKEAMNSLVNILDPDTSWDERWIELIDEWTKPLATLALPGFGNQLRKTLLGLYTMKQGGQYGANKNGDIVLKYAVDPDNPWSWIQAVFSGRSALPQAQDYYGKYEFESLTPEQTAVFDQIKNGDIQIGNVKVNRFTADDFYAAARAWNSLEDFTDANGDDVDGTREYQMRLLISGMDLSASGKQYLDELLIGQSVGKDNDGNAVIRAALYDIKDGQKRVSVYAAADQGELASLLYAYSTFGAGELKRAQAAKVKGLNWNKIVEVNRSIADLGNVYGEEANNPYTENENSDAYFLSKAQNQALAIMDMQNLSADERKAAAQLIESSWADDWDFSSEDSLLKTMLLTKTQQSQLDEYGLSEASSDDLYQAAIHLNWDWHSYRNSFPFPEEDIDTDKTAYQHYSLYGMSNLTASQKKEIGKVLFNDADNMNYNDKNTITACMVSTSCGNKWAMAYHYGFSIDEYTAAWKAAGSADTKDEKISAIVSETGISSSRASTFVSKIYYARAKVAAQYSIADDGSVNFTDAGLGGGSNYYWSRSYRRSRRSGSRRSGGSSGGGSSGGGGSAAMASGAKVWNNAAYKGYSNDDYAAAYDAASMFTTPAEKIKNVMKQTGWSWLKASTFVNLM